MRIPNLDSNSKSFTRLGLKIKQTHTAFGKFLASACCLYLILGPGLTHSEPVHLFESWIQDLETIGSKVRSGPIDYDQGSDQLKVPNFSLSYNRTYDIGDSAKRYGLHQNQNSAIFEKGIDIGFEMGWEDVVMSGLRDVDGKIGIDKVNFPNNLTLKFNFNLWGDAQISITEKFFGLSLTDSKYATPKFANSKGFGSELSWSQFFDYLGLDEFQSGRIDRIKFDVEFIRDGKRMFKQTRTDRKVKIEEYGSKVLNFYSAESHGSNAIYLSETGESFDVESFESGQIQYKGLNFQSIVELLDPPKKRATEKVQVWELFSMNKMLTDSIHSSGKAENYEVRNLKWALEDMDVLGFISMFFIFEQVEQIEPIPFLTDLIRLFYSIESKEWGINGIELTGSEIGGANSFVNSIYDPGNQLKIRIDGINSRKLPDSELGKLTFSGIGIEMVGESELIEIGEFSISDVKLPEYENVISFLGEVDEKGSIPDDPFHIARELMPRSATWEIRDLAVSSGYFGSEKSLLKIAHIRNSFNSEIPPVPTEVVIEGINIEIPVDSLEVSNFSVFLDTIGIDTLNLSYSGKLHWNEISEELLLENLKFEIADLGMVEANARFSGLKRSMLEESDLLEVGLALVSFENLNLKFTEEVAFHGFVKTSSAASGRTKEEEVKELERTILLQLASVFDSDFALQMEPELKKFLKSPSNIAIDITPDIQMNLITFFALSEVPAAIQHMLNIEVKANQ